MYLYCYDYKKPQYTLKKIKHNGSRTKEYSLTYRSPYHTGIEVNDRVYARLFSNEKAEFRKATGHNIIILIHGFSSKKKSTDNYYNFARKIISKDLSCAFINTPFHLNRTPPGEKSGKRMVYYDDIETLKFFHQCVVDIKRLIDILQEIMDLKNIYICGSSLGSMLALVTMANENRIDKGIFLLGGGNWEEIHWHGTLRFVLKGDCTHKGGNVREECAESYRDFPEFVSGLKKIKNQKIDMELKNIPGLKKTAPKMCFLCDPLAFAYKISPDKVLMINSRFDFYFNKKSTCQLWKELGRPKIYWLNALHSSKILNNEKIIARIRQFIG